MVLDYVFWALRQCRKRLLESVLIILAIALGVGVIVSVLALFAGTRQEHKAFLNQTSYRTVRLRSIEDVGLLFSETTSPLIALPETLTDSRIEFTLTNLFDLQESLPIGYAFAEQRLAFRSELLETISGEEPATPVDSVIDHIAARVRSTIPVTLCTPGLFAFLELEAAAGTLFLDSDVEQQNPVVVLGSTLAQRLFQDQQPLGQTVPLGQDNSLYAVIGVLAPSAQTAPEVQWIYGGDYDLQAFIPISAPPASANSSGQARGRIGLYNPASSSPLGDEIRVGIPQETDLGQAVQQIRDYVYFSFGDAVSVYSQYDSFRTQQERLLLMGVVTALFASIGLVIAALNILNLMIVRVLRRTRSIGVSMALGANRTAVFFQFLIEACLLGMLGTTFGIVLSFGGVRLLSQLINEPVVAGWLPVLGGVATAFVITLAFGIYPALQGASVEPAAAIRAE